MNVDISNEYTVFNDVILPINNKEGGIPVYRKLIKSQGKNNLMQK